MARVVAEGVGIKFTLARHQDRTLKRLLLHPFRREPVKEYWAVRGVSFTLENGDILGITGPNGAGKSTLLRALTGIYHPDEGRIAIQGRVSLLAIGAGFNPELTGLENIFVNGAVFGFGERAIHAMVPKIAAFADIGEFLYQPIRTYSSGMVSRLGFAVAINIDPDILLIDEVLAVGDAAFQQKCMTAIDALIRSKARIVAIVSHDPDLIARMCTRRLELTRPEQ
jgi:ABC-type polysaccharide/polyol phosphate transport system ATPase subunit